MIIHLLEPGLSKSPDAVTANDTHYQLVGLKYQRPWIIYFCDSNYLVGCYCFYRGIINLKFHNNIFKP